MWPFYIWLENNQTYDQKVYNFHNLKFWIPIISALNVKKKKKVSINIIWSFPDLS